MSTPTTRFAHLIAAHSFEDADDAHRLAQVLAQVVCINDRKPTLNERDFIARFVPRVEIPLDELASAQLEESTVDDMPEMQREVMLAVAHVVSMIDPTQRVPQHALTQVTHTLKLPLVRAANAERIAREYIVEQTFQGLYGMGQPSDAERNAAFRRLRNLGVSDSVLMAWEERFAILAAERPDAVELPKDERFQNRRHQRFMARHDPKSDRHRAPGSVSVFGAG